MPRNRVGGLQRLPPFDSEPLHDARGGDAAAQRVVVMRFGLGDVVKERGPTQRLVFRRGGDAMGEMPEQVVSVPFRFQLKASRCLELVYGLHDDGEFVFDDASCVGPA